MKNVTVFVALLVAMVLSGCKGTARLTTETSQTGGTLTVTVHVNPPTSGKLRFKGNAALEKLGDVEVKSDGSAVVEIPLGEGTSGKNKVTMTFDGVGRGLAKTVGATGSFDFDNVAVQSLRMRGVAGTGAKVPCKGSDLCESEDFFAGDDGKINVELSDCDGCTLDVGGQTISIHAPTTTATIDLTNAVGAAITPSLAELKVPFKLTTRDGRSVDTALVTSTTELLAVVLNRVSKGPLHFASESGRGPTHGATIVHANPYGVLAQSGNAEHVRDIDVVGIATLSEKSLGTCLYVRKSDPNRTPVTLDHRAQIYDVTMYDRRLGTRLGRRTFQPTDVSCNDSLEGTANATWSFPDNPAMAAWAKTFLK